MTFLVFPNVASLSYLTCVVLVKTLSFTHCSTVRGSSFMYVMERAWFVDIDLGLKPSFVIILVYFERTQGNFQLNFFILKVKAKYLPPDCCEYEACDRVPPSVLWKHLLLILMALL